MEIIFEDKDIVVCKKLIGVSSEDSETPNNMPYLLREFLNNPNQYIGVVHRLDTSVGGIMVFAKNKFAAAELSKQIQSGHFEKTYLTIIDGVPEELSGVYCDLLFKDSKKNKSFVVKTERKGVKKAVLDFSVLQTKAYNEKTFSLVKVKLLTGRSHQIRVQFSSRKTPILGDGKYGSHEKCDIALFSNEIKFLHPRTKESLCFSCLPDDKFPFNIFNIQKTD